MRAQYRISPFSPRALRLPTFRFEHDTFVTIRENAEKLKEAVTEFIPTGARAYFVAHSRGGLVARRAAALIGTSHETQVLTFGTPHKGTPLANIAKRAATALLASGRAVLLAGGVAATKVFPWDPASLAGKLLLKAALAWKFPEGIDAMRPESEFIGALNSWEPFGLRSWGGQCELDDLYKGAFAVDCREALQGVFTEAANDGIVSFASATGAGIAQLAVDSCTHFEYFSRPEVRVQITSLV